MSAVLNDPAVQSAYGEYQRFSGDPRMREKVRARERFLEEQNIILVAPKAEGLAEGETKRSVEIARNLKLMGLSIADIVTATDLSESEIASL